MVDNLSMQETNNGSGNRADETEAGFDQLVRHIESEAESLPDIASFRLDSYENNQDREKLIRDLLLETRTVQEYRDNPYYFDVGTGVKALIKRIMRKILKCVVHPLSAKQNVFNEHASKGLDAVSTLCINQQSQINSLHRQVELLMEECESLRSKLSALSSRPSGQEDGKAGI